jgi:hypothetical protein
LTFWLIEILAYWYIKLNYPVGLMAYQAYEPAGLLLYQACELAKLLAYKLICLTKQNAVRDGNSDYSRLSTKVRMTNNPAIHFVARASLESRVFALFFERNVSEPPPRAPESPEVLPDWNMTTMTSVRHTRRSIITKAVFKGISPFKW